MTAQLIEFPRSLVARTTNLRLRNQSRGLTQSLSGFQQVAASASQRWSLTLEFNNLKRQWVPSYRAILAALEGRANNLRVPIVDNRYWVPDAALGIASGVPHSDGTPFSDGALYRVGDLAGIAATGEAGAKTIDIDFTSFAALSPLSTGLYFGIEDDLYICTNIEWLGTVATISFQPGLRRDYAAGVFRLRPFLICRLADDDVGDHALEWNLATAPTLNLEEVYT